MKRLNRIAKRILAFDEAVKQFIQECEDSGKFDNEQMNEISVGFLNGLSIEEVKLYANPKLDGWDKMKKIRKDLQNGMSIEKVKEKYNL